MKVSNQVRPSAELSSTGAEGTDSDTSSSKGELSMTLRVVKRAMDIAISLLFFTAFGWLYLLLLIGVIVSSGAPAIYSQPRYGKDGKIFKFFKFRSMVTDSQDVLEKHLLSNSAARKQWADFQKLEDDPRITRFGALIRKTSLDELPQFWNVLKGDMSLIGPRPCMLDQKSLYGAYWSYYARVRPGITGLWQVSGRNNLSFKMRVELDVKYVQTLSILGDIKIFIKTIKVVLTGDGSR